MDGLLSDYDSDGSGTLSISEFETLHSALIREMMVDRFQHLDADGEQGRLGSDHGMMNGEDSRMEGNNSGMQGQHGN